MKLSRGRPVVCIQERGIVKARKRETLGSQERAEGEREEEGRGADKNA